MRKLNRQKTMRKKWMRKRFFSHLAGAAGTLLFFLTAFVPDSEAAETEREILPAGNFAAMPANKWVNIVSVISNMVSSRRFCTVTFN